MALVFSQTGFSRTMVRSLGASLGVVMAVSGSAIAAPGDVVVPTTPAPGSGGDVVVPPPGGSNPLASNRFSCQTSGGQYTVMYSPESQPNQFYPWASPSQMGGGWSPEARCTEIARRLESYRPDGLTEMRTQMENGLNTICVTTDRVPGCRIVMTVPPGQDAIATRDRVFENLLIADSGQSTIAVNTFTGGGLGSLGSLFGRPRPTTVKSPAGINLRPFLDVKDGGTGERVNRRTSAVKPAVKPAVKKPSIFRLIK